MSEKGKGSTLVFPGLTAMLITDISTEASVETFDGTHMDSEFVEKVVSDLVDRGTATMQVLIGATSADPLSLIGTTGSLVITAPGGESRSEEAHLTGWTKGRPVRGLQSGTVTFTYSGAPVA